MLATIKPTVTVLTCVQHQTRVRWSVIPTYWALNPAHPIHRNDPPPTLLLSVHGAGMLALGQAEAYSPKIRGQIVAQMTCLREHPRACQKAQVASKLIAAGA